MTRSLFAVDPDSLLPPRPGQWRTWVNLHGGSRALALVDAVRALDCVFVVLSKDPHTASRLANEVEFFRDDHSVCPLVVFPDWETLPYDQFSPYQDIVSERLRALQVLAGMRRGIVIVPVSTFMHRLLPRDHLQASRLCLETGTRLDLAEFRRTLIRVGYRIVPQVLEHGDLAFRGALLDVFPMGSERPFRIDLLDDEIDSIRCFDPENQRSSGKLQRVEILPAKEISLTPESIECFRSKWRRRFSGNPAGCTMYNDVSNGFAPAGIEYYLPLFYEKTATLFDYISRDAVIVVASQSQKYMDAFWHDVEERYDQLRHDKSRPLLKPAEIFVPPQEIRAGFRAFRQVQIADFRVSEDTSKHVDFGTRVPMNLRVDARAAQPFAVLERFLNDFGGRTLIVAESSGRRETITELLQQAGMRPRLISRWPEFLAGNSKLEILAGALEQGVHLDQLQLVVITEGQLFGERAQQQRLRRRRSQDADAIIRNLTELTVGAPVVHADHGVGRFKGLVTIDVAGVESEYIQIEYAQGDKLYVPVASLDLVSRFTGVDPDLAPLHRLGSGQWDKARRRAAEKARDVAVELLELHSRRAARSGHAFIIDEEEYRAFVQEFPFEETAGQADAIEQVLHDLRSTEPMDRLVCGDSGFGKTEVAMRAAFIAVQNNKQVAVLVPTTLLAQQHHKNFCDRFSNWPVRVEMLSRFVTGRKQSAVIAETAEGKVDIVIGTHKLLSGDIKFRDLGLLVIDEEHRFGVRQKERLKSLRAEVDILTLTATPIPRTLNLALSDLRQLSIMATPPARRLAVKTFVREWHDAVLYEAMLREIRRGGQVYFLHNEIKTIGKIAKSVQTMLPDARVRVAHGQMPERDLERTMLDFYHQKFNVLVCSTIIETGIDIPTANTMIINRADKFGLAQLYQLRGRVGRSHHRAYAYLIVPPSKSISDDAIKRLQAIESLEDLGVGFMLATHDLEIRGAGEILGEGQSGHIQEIGFTLYMDLLERAVHSLRRGGLPEFDPRLDHGVEVDLRIRALIPDDYLPDVHTRLIMYKRIASTRNQDELTALREEMVDRFGSCPEAVKNLFALTRIKQQAGSRGIRKVEMGDGGGRILFSGDSRVDPGTLAALVQSEPGTFRFDGNEILRINLQIKDGKDRIRFVGSILDQLSLQDAA